MAYSNKDISPSLMSLILDIRKLKAMNLVLVPEIKKHSPVLHPHLSNAMRKSI
jgi:hypothetical protein